MKKYMNQTVFILLLFCFACGANNKKEAAKEQPEERIKAPVFNPDSAYGYVKAQVDFGPRVPNTKAHEACGDYLASKLSDFGAQVTNQRADLRAFDGTILKARNIIGAYNPESKKRIALFAHWDSRPWADNDPDESNYHTPILGANDGASGVGVLLEIARQIQLKQPELGVDIIFLDAEDYGTPKFHEGESEEDSWCLGSQYWAQRPHEEGYNARFGILLDMVGGKGATFYKERYSNDYAPSVVKKVWEAASLAGYGNFFIDQYGGYATDDHLFINRLAKLPTIDIIPYDPGSGEFSPVWHTVRDNLDAIDPATLKAVGQTVMEVIYNEK